MPSKSKQTQTKRKRSSAATAMEDPSSDTLLQLADAAFEQEEGFSVDKLLDGGISQADISKLKGAGILTLPGLHMVCTKNLISIKGLSEAKVSKILETARALSASPFQTASQLLEKRSQIIRLTTGSTALDALLGGGIESSSITEVFGEFRTGKTQLAHMLCVTAQLSLEHHGGNGKAVYIDTEGTFRPERIAAIAVRFGLEPKAVLDNVIVARAYTHEQQSELLQRVMAERMAEDPIALIVVDSVTALFRVDFSGRGELAERQQKLAQVLSRLTKLAEEFNVAVFITNQVVSDPGAAAMFVADPKKPIGGNIIAHASTTRLSLRKGRAEQRVCKIYDSPLLPESECVFAISEQGIQDATN